MIVCPIFLKKLSVFDSQNYCLGNWLLPYIKSKMLNLIAFVFIGYSPVFSNLWPRCLIALSSLEFFLIFCTKSPSTYTNMLTMQKLTPACLVILQSDCQPY